MKAIQPIIATAVLIFGMVTCSGWAQDNPVVLTPTKLYEMIHSANVLNYERNQHIKELLYKFEETQQKLNKIQVYRVDELERKVSGQAKVITQLFARTEKLERAHATKDGSRK